MDKRHDASMLADSGLLDNLEQHSYSPDGNPLCIYGDPAYPLRVHLQAPFRDGIITPEMRNFNTSIFLHFCAPFFKMLEHVCIEIRHLTILVWILHLLRNTLLVEYNINTFIHTRALLCSPYLLSQLCVCLTSLVYFESLTMGDQVPYFSLPSSLASGLQTGG